LVLLKEATLLAKYVFFGGKGGVGKTTCAASFACMTAQKKELTLLVSSDPAHSLGDLFDIELKNQPLQIRNKLDCLEINPEEESRHYITKVKHNLMKIVSPVILEEIEKQIDAASVSPGSEEAAIFDKIVEIINEYGERYQHIVFDTAPTGHTLRLMTLPELLGSWLERMIEKRTKAISLTTMAERNYKEIDKILDQDPVLCMLQLRKKNLEKAREVLIDEKRLRFIFVLNPEKLPIQETKKAIEILGKHGIKVSELIVNKVMPEQVEGEFWRLRKEQEKKHIDNIKETLGHLKIMWIPLMQYDVQGEELNEIAEKMKDHFETENKE